MLLTLLFAVLFIVSLVLYIKSATDWFFDDWLEIILIIIATFSGIVLFICSLIIMTVQIPSQIDYEKALYEREQLIEQYEDGNQYAYDSIIEFDKELRDTKYWGDNLWLNWFYNQKIIDGVDYISYDGPNE